MSGFGNKTFIRVACATWNEKLELSAAAKQQKTPWKENNRQQRVASDKVQ
jgi:hypothetical protein